MSKVQTKHELLRDVAHETGILPKDDLECCLVAAVDKLQVLHTLFLHLDDYEQLQEQECDGLAAMMSDIQDVIRRAVEAMQQPAVKS